MTVEIEVANSAFWLDSCVGALENGNASTRPPLTERIFVFLEAG